MRYPFTIRTLDALIKDESEASKRYKGYAKFALTKKDKNRLLSMSKDEARHERWLKDMKKQEKKRRGYSDKV